MRGTAQRGASLPGFVLLVLGAVLLITCAGCLWGRTAKGTAPLPPGEAEEIYTQIEEEDADDGSPTTEPGGLFAAKKPPDAERSGEADAIAAPAVGPETSGDGQPPGAAGAQTGPAGMPPETSAAESTPGEAVVPKATEEAKVPPERAPRAAPRRAPSPAAKAFAREPSEVPAWAVGKEVLVYRVEFLGMTMGYARFTFKGRVSLRGKDVYHLNVRAWTSDFLSVIYPINDTIDYFLDVDTLAPVRQEFTHAEKKKDDVMIYDQETGKIVYRYKATGEIRKQVETSPNVYDPVSAAYYFRSRDLGEEERPRNVYGGRKLYQISTKLLGQEKIEVDGRRVDTVVVRPLIKRDGMPDDKGDLRMWMTTDARHIPVRFYAKFRKIREWTLHAELIPPREGG